LWGEVIDTRGGGLKCPVALRRPRWYWHLGFFDCLVEYLIGLLIAIGPPPSHLVLKTIKGLLFSGWCALLVARMGWAASLHGHHFPHQAVWQP
ncbi:hypothetical protein, partial [Ottowia sp.]|uniref:hypothetical protein n=1 Tax=Ottowia sp. TaxID=1898956 RepID=UPI003A83C914